ncbi:hypothetical protein [Sinorhizobium americanum]|uniref:hypothetical protein n=1 Tax=Sinorhizobium americanum TaxID=194963 RepID=UPI001FD8A741|nr:hypothetical protein [Sinorhizobium americanum]
MAATASPMRHCHFLPLHVGDTLKVCFLEAVLRDRGDGLVGDLPLKEKEIYARRSAEIEPIVDLRLVDLREDHAIQMGVPTDVAKSSRQTLARRGRLLSMSPSPRRTASSIHHA